MTGDEDPETFEVTLEILDAIDVLAKTQRWSVKDNLLEDWVA
ncbi:hypothetical protein PBI_ARISSANAE_87 [Mycobacterium phage Arissanae]|nr:hypothetical protein PBI_ARISSANAE_87 [Mycobacterium phage Arissanae]